MVVIDIQSPHSTYTHAHNGRRHLERALRALFQELHSNRQDVTAGPPLNSLAWRPFGPAPLRVEEGRQLGLLLYVDGYRVVG